MFLQATDHILEEINPANKTLNIGWLSTGNGSGSLGLLKEGIKLHNNKTLNINFVFSNREYGEKEGSDKYLDLVKKNKIEAITLSSRRFKTERGLPWKDLRVDYDKKVLNSISKFNVDILVAAGYMLFSPIICNHFEILNLHPALPDGPNGTWKSVIKELIESKSRNSGISIHLMTSDLDEGPNISFCKFIIDHNNNQNLIEIEETEIFSSIREKQIMYERVLLGKTLLKISKGEINIKKDFYVDLTKEVEQSL